MRGFFTAVTLLAAITARAADCVSTSQLVSARSSELNRTAGPIAFSGSVLGVAKNETNFTKSIWFGLYDEQLNTLRPDVKVVDGSFDGAQALLWSGSDFGLFYLDTFGFPRFFRIAADGTPVGGAVALPHGVFPEDEFSFAWDPFRQAYLVLHSITQGPENGLWLTAIGRDGSIKFDRLLYTFIASPAVPRVAAAADGTIGVLFVHKVIPGTSYLRLDAQERFFAPVQVSAVQGRRVVIAARGNQFGIAMQAGLAGGRTEIRWLVIESAGTVVVSDRTLVTPRGIDVAPVSLVATPTEWALAYDESIHGFREFAGEYRLRRFTQTGAMLSDTLFASDALRSTLLTRFPLVWTGTSFISSIARLIPNEGSDSYLIRHCPLIGTASADQTILRLLDTIRVTATATGGSPEYTFTWDFGDNTRAEGGPVVTHRYDRFGTYTVTLTTTDRAGGRHTTTMVIRVVPGKVRSVR